MIIFCAWGLDNVLARLIPPFTAPAVSLITLLRKVDLVNKRFLLDDVDTAVIVILEGLSPGNSEAMVFCMVVVSNPSASFDA